MAERVPMTPEGQQKLRDELHRLRDIEMPQVVRDIGTAREHGDLKENAEYHAAKDRQGMIHARAKYLEDSLSRAEVIDPSKLSGNTVKFGAHVSLMNLETDEVVAYQIVGAEESDINIGRISISAPLARALIAKQVGDEISVRLPAGNRTFEIQEIEFR